MSRRFTKSSVRKTANQNTATMAARKEIPVYGNRSSWNPRTVSDFGDGGSFPEIQMPQNPLDIGRKDGGQNSNALAIQLDAEGKIKYQYDAIARQGHGNDKVVYSKFTDLLPAEVKNEDDPSLRKPSDDEIAYNTEKTRLALERITNQKVRTALPVRVADKLAPAQFIRYTPAQRDDFNSGAKQRIIKMVEVQRDPMEPPRFKINQKIPRAPPSPPAPVLHSPPRKLTLKEQQEWKIPPCISNWKNKKGYTIPLDKRLAADGRGLQQLHINEKFAKLAESLYIAERKARESVELHAQIQKKQAQIERAKKEEDLLQLARQVRDERAGLRSGANREEDNEAAERDNLRQERHRERQRERNLVRAAPGDKGLKSSINLNNDFHSIRRSKFDRQRERDISEQIALGMPARASTSGEAMFDQRLLNQTRGMDSGFGDDEAYNVYDKPWREQGTLSHKLYRPSKDLDQDLYGDDLDKLVKTSKFVPNKEFSGTDRAGPSGPRTGPVQFEKEEDPFGLDKFLTEVRNDSSKRPIDEERSNKGKGKRWRRD